MTDKNYKALLSKGNNILEKIMPDLNKISEIALKQDGTFDRFMDLNMNDPHVIREIKEAWERLSIN